MEIYINETKYTLDVSKFMDSIIVEEITSIDGEEPLTSAPGYFQLISMIETFCQDILIDEYERICEQEKAELAIDSFLTGLE